MNLPPGNYVATCWQTGKAGGGTGPPHVTIGMIAPFTASTTATAPASEMKPVVSYSVSVQNFTYQGMPSCVPANTPIVVGFTNKESFEIDHEFVVLKLPAGKTPQDVIATPRRRAPRRGRLDPRRRQRRPAPHQLRPRGHHGPPAGELRGDLLADRQGRRWDGPAARDHRHDRAVHRLRLHPRPGGAGAPVSYNVFVKNFTYHGMPSSVPANKAITIGFITRSRSRSTTSTWC